MIKLTRCSQSSIHFTRLVSIITTVCTTIQVGSTTAVLMINKLPDLSNNLKLFRLCPKWFSLIYQQKADHPVDHTNLGPGVLFLIPQTLCKQKLIPHKYAFAEEQIMRDKWLSLAASIKSLVVISIHTGGGEGRNRGLPLV